MVEAGRDWRWMLKIETLRVRVIAAAKSEPWGKNAWPSGRRASDRRQLHLSLNI